jgi:hypothetical protein
VGMTKELGWSGFVLGGRLVQGEGLRSRWEVDEQRVGHQGWLDDCEGVPLSQGWTQSGCGAEHRTRQDLWAQHSPDLLFGRSWPVAPGAAR